MEVLVRNYFEAVICLIPDLNLITFGFQLLELFLSLRCFEGLAVSCNWLLTKIR